MAVPFTRSQLQELPTELLREGRFGHARVSCVECDGRRWTVKDFSPRHLLVRLFWGTWVLARELKILNLLKGIDGIAEEAFRIDRYAIAIEYKEGERLIYADESLRTKALFLEMEALLKQVHQKGVVHLDTRGWSNWLLSPEGKPVLIDFQTGLVTDYLPKRIRYILELIDLSGVYKKWLIWCPESIDERRRKLYLLALKWSHFWLINQR